MGQLRSGSETMALKVSLLTLSSWPFVSELAWHQRVCYSDLWP